MFDIPHASQDDVLPLITLGVERAKVVDVECSHCLARAENRSPIGMATPELCAMEIKDQVVERILDPGDFLDHDALFELQVGRVQARIENQVREDIERHGQMLVEHMSLIARELASRVRIEAPPEGFQGERNFMGAPALRTLEYEVLHQMTHTSRFGRFVGGTLFDPNTHCGRSYVGPPLG